MTDPSARFTFRRNPRDLRRRNLWIILGGGVAVYSGLFAALCIPSVGWLNALAAAAPVWYVVRSFVSICATTLRREKFDKLDVAGFAAAALIVLGAIIGLFAVVYRHLGLLTPTAETHDPWSSLYFSIITWTTVGYGDFIPTQKSRPFAAAEAMIGYICMALLTAAIIQIITRYQPPKTVSGRDLIGEKDHP